MQIQVALSFLEGEAAIWGSRYAKKIYNYNNREEEDFPFNGKWKTFEKEFKAWFGSLDEELEAAKKLWTLRQGRTLVSQYAQKFQDLAERTEFSDWDLQEKFYKELVQLVQIYMISMELAQR